jgi:hypothetical protein
MRHLVLLVLGLAIGAFATTSIINALRQRDAYPRGLMQVMQHHFAALRDDVRRNRCDDNSRSQIAVLHQLSDEIGASVYAGDTPDASFREYEQRLRDALVMPQTCAGLPAAFDKISAACDACHHQFR